MIMIRKITLTSGYSMPIIGLGTFKIRGPELVQSTLEAAIKSGYRSIDSASVYRNEKDIATSLSIILPKYGLQRSDVFITSKLAPKDQGSSACEAAVNMSLQNFSTDYLDLYLIHWPGTQKKKPDDPDNVQLRRESWQSLEKLHKQGKLRSIGVSNYTVRHMKELLSYCTVKPAVLQTEFHPHLVQGELVALCGEHGIHFQAYSSLGTSAEENKLMTDPNIRHIAEKTGKTVAQVLLRWAVQNNIGVIPKSTNPQHIEENIEIFDFELSEEDMEVMTSLHKDSHYAWNPHSII